MAPRLESEFKLRAVRQLEVAAFDATLREAGFACRSAEARNHADDYLDDDRGSLAAAGIGLRVRDDGARRRITYKAKAEARDGLFVRPEVEAIWSATDPPTRAAELPGQLRDLVEPFVLDRPLQVALHLAVRRDHRTLQQEGRDLCEAMLDQVTASRGDRAVEFTEVEVEVLDDLPTCEHLVQALTERLPLRVATDDKPGHAKSLLGETGAARPQKWHRDDRAGDALALLAHRRFAELRLAETGVRVDGGPNHVHAMRVAVRRLHGLLRALRAAWPAAAVEAAIAHLTETNRHLGAVRDLDVMLQHLPRDIERLPPGLHTPARAWLAWLQHRRQEELATLVAWLRSPARIAACREAEQRTIAADDPGTSIGELATDALGKALRKARTAIEELPEELALGPTHACRVRIKRLRYLAEEFAPLLPREADKSIEALARLQARLGDVCDHEQAAARFLGWTVSAPDALVGAVLGGLATVHAQAARAARRRARATLDDDARGRVWRRLRSS